MSRLRGCGQTWLVVGIPHTIEELDADPRIAMRLLDRLVVAFPLSAVALAGTLPSLIHRAGGIVKAPVVGGSTGTRCMVLNAAFDLARCVGLPLDALDIVVIGGAGFLGSLVVCDLARRFRKVVAFDPRFESSTVDRNVLRTFDPLDLRASRLVMLFTPRGDDLSKWVPSLAEGSLIVDGTHPSVGPVVQAQLVEAKVKLLKAAAENSVQPFRLFPRLPNFRRDSVPGCLLEALVVAHHGRDVIQNFDIFCQEARALGFSSQLMEDLREPLLKDVARSSHDMTPIGTAPTTVGARSKGPLPSFLGDGMRPSVGIALKQGVLCSVVASSNEGIGDDDEAAVVGGAEP